MKIIALPFAGGSKHSFNYLRKELENKSIDLVGIGYFDSVKNNKYHKKTIQEVAAIILKSILPIIADEPYVVYGHSMGALVGYEICKIIAQKNLPLPLKLVVSGRNAPCHSVDHKTYTLPSDNFWKVLDELGGLPNELLLEKSIREMLEPGLRKDFECVETYQYQIAQKLPIPIDVFYGTTEGISESNIYDWNRETDKNVQIQQLTGNHFFIFDHTPYFIQYFQSIFQINATI
ncbi:thioesterase II family protein [Kordia jejudonensis]|uniref:thioesterase II family protein n=1 Tax=Kordia jejudonensis TaxID=1348245 RepID=UPI0006291BCD|nr:thioesterase domain-containing protein [Kordia jejudonensis]